MRLWMMKYPIIVFFHHMMKKSCTTFSIYSFSIGCYYTSNIFCTNQVEVHLQSNSTVSWRTWRMFSQNINLHRGMKFLKSVRIFHQITSSWRRCCCTWHWFISSTKWVTVPQKQMLTMTVAPWLYKSGSFSETKRWTPMPCSPIAFSIPAGVSTIRGGLWPSRSDRNSPFTEIPPSVLRLTTSAYSTP